MKFKSKIDWWAYLVFAAMLLANIGCAAGFILRGGLALAVCFVLFFLINAFLIVPIWTKTYYVLEDTELRVKCGFFSDTRMACGSIKRVKESKSLLASSGLSLDRIEIVFGSGGVVYISPQNKQEFLKQLAQRRG